SGDAVGMETCSIEGEARAKVIRGTQPVRAAHRTERAAFARKEMGYTRFHVTQAGQADDAGNGIGAVERALRAPQHLDGIKPARQKILIGSLNLRAGRI